MPHKSNGMATRHFDDLRVSIGTNIALFGHGVTLLLQNLYFTH
jgi:hypothetical protein